MGNKQCSDVEVSQFSYKLQQLLDAGIPLLRALSIMRSGSNKTQKERYGKLESCLYSGDTLAGALRSIHFPTFFCSLIAFSEHHGQLTETLDLTSQYYRKRNSRKQQLRKTLTYPFLVLISSSITLILVVFFLLPQFASLYETLGIPLPWMIRSIEAFNYVWVKWILLCLSFSSLWVGYLCRYKRPNFTLCLLKIPLISILLKLHLNYLITSQLALLLEGGVQILEICRLFREEAPSELISKAFYTVDSELCKGNTLSEAFREIPWILPIFIELISVAEQSGMLAPTLKSLGEQFERELDVLLNRLANFTQNFLLIGTGGAVFIMLFSLFYPMLTVIGQL